MPRCQTIALNNRYIFNDLGKLRVPPAFFTLVLYANDRRITFYEVVTLLVCLGLVSLAGGVIGGCIPENGEEKEL